MTDRELLERAARAVRQERSAAGDLWSNARGALWDPINDDGDEARLEANLWLSVEWSSDYVMVGDCSETFDRETGDRQAARRRAGVRAAAAIGSAMP